jgi:hypothetical protein
LTDILNARWVGPLGADALDPIQRYRGGETLPGNVRAGSLAVVFGHESRALPMAWGETPEAAEAEAMRQYAGTSPTLQAHYRERIVLIGLTADEASE